MRYLCGMNTTPNVLESIREVAQNTLPPNGNLILYGSRARGDARKDSDWDLLVILDKNAIDSDDYDKVSYPYTELGWSLGEMIIPVLYTKKEWEASSFTPFYKNVVKEGIRIL